MTSFVLRTIVFHKAKSQDFSEEIIIHEFKELLKLVNDGFMQISQGINQSSMQNV